MVTGKKQFEDRKMVHSAVPGLCQFAGDILVEEWFLFCFVLFIDILSWKKGSLEDQHLFFGSGNSLHKRPHTSGMFPG